ncbi:hypothetical protein ABFS82_07G073500 [Erythranthe guttata]
MEQQRHVLLVTFPAQGHISPSFQFAKRPTAMGIKVTFATSLYARRRMSRTAAGLPKGVTFAAFSGGYDDGSKGSQSLRDTILAAADQDRPVTQLVYTLLLPWAPEVAREFHVPSALLWIQPATVLIIYYYYFNGYGDEIATNSDDTTWQIQSPGIPALNFAKRDLPSFVLPSSSDKYSFALPSFKEPLETLDAEKMKPKVLVNIFDALEPHALKSIDKYEPIGVGPLITSAPSDKSFGGDLFEKSDDNSVELWLNSKPESSVVYVSFGNILKLPKAQMEEIAKGILESERPFLWVIRINEDKKNEEEEEEEKLSCLYELEKIGKIVPWCSQLDVLTHPSIGCFVSHCGWNLTLESLSSGVLVVAFPQWTDQGTNAKLIEDVWKSGVRVRGVGGGDGVVESGEIKRCIEEVMDGGGKSWELRANAREWKSLAREDMDENGSSFNNLKAFLEDS